MKFGVKVAPEMQLLSIIKELDFRYVELYINKKLLNEDSLDTAMRFNFEYILHSPIDFFDDSVVDFAIKLGSKTVVMHQRPEIQPEAFKKTVKRAKNFGVQVCAENSPTGLDRSNVYYRLPITPEDFFKMKEQIPELKLCLDVEHAMLAKLFPRMIRLVGKDIGHVHITGYPPNYHSPPFANRAMFEIAIRELKNVGFEGMVVAEMDVQYQTEDVFRRLKEFYDGFDK
jgi:sugar phosphate isomerase/epimerase